jgi:hypothetical protein
MTNTVIIPKYEYEQLKSENEEYGRALKLAGGCNANYIKYIGELEAKVAELQSKLDEIEKQEPVAEVIVFRGGKQLKYFLAFKNAIAGDKLYLR